MPTRKRDKLFTRQTIERSVYVILIAALTVWGLWHSEAAAMLINAIQGAFSLLFNTQ